MSTSSARKITPHFHCYHHSCRGYYLLLLFAQLYSINNSLFFLTVSTSHIALFSYCWQFLTTHLLAFLLWYLPFHNNIQQLHQLAMLSEYVRVWFCAPIISNLKSITQLPQNFLWTFCHKNCIYSERHSFIYSRQK
jgi:hypothetical protein